MSEGPWIRFFPSDWLAGTRGLSATETGVYITLISMMYERGAPVPHEPTRLARLCGTTLASFRTVVNFLIENDKIEERDDGLWNRKVEAEVKERRGKSEVARASAERRWSRKRGKNKDGPMQTDMPLQSGGNANHNHTLSSSFHSDESGGARERTASPIVVLQSVVDAMTAQTFVAHCAEKRRPLSSQQAEAIVATLKEVRALGGNPAEALRVAVKRGWVSLEIEYLRNNGFPFKASAPPAAEDWPGRLKVWGEDRTWAMGWGPKPGETGCRVPAELLTGVAA